MPAYDTSLNPPAPVAKVTLRDPATESTVADVPVLLDSGAEVTLVPKRFVSELGGGIEVGHSYQLDGFDGSRSVASAGQSHMVFLSCSNGNCPASEVALSNYFCA